MDTFSNKLIKYFFHSFLWCRCSIVLEILDNFFGLLTHTISSNSCQNSVTPIHPKSNLVSFQSTVSFLKRFVSFKLVFLSWIGRIVVIIKHVSNVLRLYVHGEWLFFTFLNISPHFQKHFRMLLILLIE
jgi:hypothetical protein